MQIILEVINPKNGLSKTVNITRYTANEISKAYSIYTNAGFSVYLKEGLERVIERSKMWAV